MINSIARAFLFSIIFVLSIAPVFAAGGEEGLYDTVPPEGSAFVRFIHAQPGPSEMPVKVNGRSYDPAIYGAIKPYVVVPPVTVKLSLGDAATEYKMEPGKHYAAILENSVLRVIEEPFEANKLKAQIMLFNLSKTPGVTLKTADGKISVVGPVEPGAVQSKLVNAVKVSFALFSGDKKIADLADQPLERGEGYAVVLMTDPGGKPKITYEKARTSRN